LLFSFALAGFMALPSSADSIDLTINGDASVGSNYINFGNYPTGTVFKPAPDYGTFETTNPISGIFASGGVTPGEMGMIQSLDEPTGMQPCPSATNGLCNGAFMTFNGGGSNLQLWATNIPDGGQGAGPFVLTDVNGNAVASFAVDGYVWDTNANGGKGGKVDTFTGTFSATFDGTPVASLFTNLPRQTGFTATFTATTIPVTGVPEPASMLLMGAGLLGVGLISRRKTRKS
jgi:hypothetical protein